MELDTTSNVSRRHRGPKRKLRPGYRMGLVIECRQYNARPMGSYVRQVLLFHRRV